MTRLLVALALAGCVGGADGGGGGGDPVDDGPRVRSATESGTTDRDGLWRVPVEVEEGDLSFLVTADGDATLSVEAVYDGDGEEVVNWRDWYGGESLTSAFFPYYDQTVLNWPVRAEDPELTPGTWEVELAATTNSGNYESDVDIDATVQIKHDDDPTEGTVTMRVVYGAGLEDDENVVAATEAAVERWREVWAAFDLTLDETYDVAPDIDANVDEDLGSRAIENAAKDGTDTDLMVIIVEEIGGDSWTYGITGNIPWTTLPMPHAAVAVSWLAHAGTNGSFAEDEISLMGETMGHEVGHYMGLFHPVEGNYQSYDAIDDTEECDTWRSCEQDLGDNLMYPYPVCSGGGCRAQDDLTDGQQGVVHRYLGAM